MCRISPGLLLYMVHSASTPPIPVQCSCAVLLKQLWGYMYCLYGFSIMQLGGAGWNPAPLLGSRIGSAGIRLSSVHSSERWMDRRLCLPDQYHTIQTVAHYANFPWSRYIPRLYNHFSSMSVCLPGMRQCLFRWFGWRVPWWLCPIQTSNVPLENAHSRLCPITFMGLEDMWWFISHHLESLCPNGFSRRRQNHNVSKKSMPISANLRRVREGMRELEFKNYMKDNKGWPEGQSEILYYIIVPCVLQWAW